MEVYRITPDASVYYVTYTVADWLPVFVAEAAFKIVTDSLTFCHAQKGLRINAYVIMPTHLHAIVFHKDHDAKQLATVLNDFRRHTGKALVNHCASDAPAAFMNTLAGAAATDRQRRFWQASRHPMAVQGERFWQQKLDYLHANPSRKGLVLYPEDWRFSSARYYASGRYEPGDVPITELTW